MCVPVRTVVASSSVVHKKGIQGVTMVTVGHVTAAVSCCLEMVLWSTLWMVDEVSLMASGGLSASRKR